MAEKYLHLKMHVKPMREIIGKVEVRSQMGNNNFYVGYYEDHCFAHYGILGQKWGIRRYQNPDGTLTQEGITRYRRDKVLNNIGRALTNTSLGQRLAVNLNKGYKEDKKEIKALYKSKLREDDEEYNKKLKSDYKKTKGEARTTAAKVNYSWQSDDANERIQTQNLGKQFLTSLLYGGYGAQKYDRVKADTGKTGYAFLAGIGFAAAQGATRGAFAYGDYAYSKYKADLKKKSNDGLKKDHENDRMESVYKKYAKEYLNVTTNYETDPALRKRQLDRKKFIEKEVQDAVKASGAKDPDYETRKILKDFKNS